MVSVLPLWLLPFFPLLGSVCMLLFGRKLARWSINAICLSAAGASFAMALWTFSAYRAVHPAAVEQIAATWLPFTGAAWGLLLDPLSALMMLVVTGIGFLVHVFSVSYMEHEPGYWRYFGGLNFFIAAMLLLVLANNYALLFAGWEAVGFASYLLIGFSLDRPAAARAATKAFLVNRIGDAGLLLGLVLLYQLTGSFRFVDVQRALQGIPADPMFGLVSLTALLLFWGAAGKSAQFPLHVWLPDAMEGPTPVSALIHAATMVTAGVYLLARAHTVFDLAPQALAVVAAAGALTALLAASAATAQNDLKRVLAWSTVSQLGLMFVALGVGAYWAAIFHLVTHAFFKALLFLGAGAIIHALSGKQDLRRMGGLARPLPLLHALMMTGALALAGVPGLAGFFSKDEILLAAYSSPSGSPLLFAAGLLVSALTGFYSWRLLRMVFHGESSAAAAFPAHHSPALMLLPLAVLAIGSAAAGWPLVWFRNWLAPVLGGSESAEGVAQRGWLLMALASLAALLGIFAAARFSLPARMPPILAHGWYLDRFYQSVLVDRVALGSGSALSRFDSRIVDGGVNSTALLTRLSGRFLSLWDIHVVDGGVRFTALAVRLSGIPVRLLQTGSVQTYALFVLAGLLVVLGVYIAR